LAIHVPDPNSSTGGPFEGALISTFDCIVTSSMIPVGYMNFTVGPSGCLTQVQTGFPFGSAVTSCTGAIDAGYDSWFARAGNVCVGGGAWDVCSPIVDPPPYCICFAGGPYFGQVGTPVQFGGEYIWCLGPEFTWDFGDGSTATGQSVAHVYRDAGVYTVRFCLFETGRCPQQESCSETTAIIQAPAAIEDPLAFPQITPSTWGGVKASRHGR
jgi:hypothetical protein